MAKSDIIDEIIATRNPHLMIDALWEDTAIMARVRSKLNAVSEENIQYYHKHYCGDD